jgi:hypothetical protein
MAMNMFLEDAEISSCGGRVETNLDSADLAVRATSGDAPLDDHCHGQ